MIFLMIFLGVAVEKQVEAYRQGPGCGALLTQNIVNETFIVTGSFNSSFDETHALLNSSNGWCSRSLDPNQHLLVELGKVATITGFDIQGRSSSNQYVTDFTMSYKATKQMPSFRYYSRFMASPSSGDEIVHFQVNATDMQVIGFFPRTFQEHICMRVELYGCVPVDGGYTPWSAWNSCSNLCGNGTQRRHRECCNPAPANDGQRCVGNSTETRACVNTSCPGLSEWSEWTSCSVICGNGSQSRSRNCTNLRPRNGVKSCKEYRTCRLEQCEVDRTNSSSSSVEGDQRKDKFFILMVVLAAALPAVIVT